MESERLPIGLSCSPTLSSELKKCNKNLDVYTFIIDYLFIVQKWSTKYAKCPKTVKPKKQERSNNNDDDARYAS